MTNKHTLDYPPIAARCCMLSISRRYISLVRNPVGTYSTIPTHRTIDDFLASSVTSVGDEHAVVVISLHNLHDKKHSCGAALWPPPCNTQPYYPTYVSPIEDPISMVHFALRPRNSARGGLPKPPTNSLAPDTTWSCRGINCPRPWTPWRGQWGTSRARAWDPSTVFVTSLQNWGGMAPRNLLDPSMDKSYCDCTQHLTREDRYPKQRMRNEREEGNP